MSPPILPFKLVFKEGTPSVGVLSSYLKTDDIREIAKAWIWTNSWILLQKWLWKNTSEWKHPYRYYVAFAERYNWTPDIVDNLPADLVVSFIKEWERQADKQRW
jgi:hypothetical protein